MFLDWDEEARALNARLHGQDFTDIAALNWFAAEALALGVDAAGDERIVAIAGLFEQVHVVVLSWRAPRMTILRSRRAMAAERHRFDRRLRFTRRPDAGGEAAIVRAIAADPQSRGPDAAQLAEMRPALEVLPADWFDLMEAQRRTQAMQRSAPVSRQVTLRLDPELLRRFRAEGTGWRRRVNETLRRARGL